MKIQTFKDREEWLSARRGKITGSRLKDVVSTGSPLKEQICAVLKESGVEFDPKAKKEDLEPLLTVEQRQALLLKLPKKNGYYELIAERIATVPDGENAMDRGTRLEEEAIQRFETETGKKVKRELVIWSRDEHDSIAISPDGSIGKTEAVEAKCLSSASHIKAWLTQQIPDEYEFQALQYFIVNDALTKLHLLFYDPRIPVKEFFTITVTRKEWEQKIQDYLEYERQLMLEVEEVVNSLTF